jgi:hypothetical protein
MRHLYLEVPTFMIISRRDYYTYDTDYAVFAVRSEVDEI